MILKVYVFIFLFLTIIPGNIYAQVNVTLPDIKVNTGNPDTYFPVIVDDITGKNITAFEFDIHYNKNIIYLLKASSSGTLSSAGGYVANPDTANGLIKVAWANSDPMSGAGVLINILVKFRGEGTSILTFRNSMNEEKFLFNTGSPSAIIADGSVIIKNISGVDHLFSSVPADYKLFQNYPNPFNPVTNIQYAIPVESFVTIKIFDLPGNEISTLVNEVKQAGNYSVKVYGDKLASGIYIYKMQAGNFNSSKKFLLLK